MPITYQEPKHPVTRHLYDCLHTTSHKILEVFRECRDRLGTYPTVASFVDRSGDPGKKPSEMNKWGKHAANYQINRGFIFMKTFLLQGDVCPCPGRNIHVHVYDHYFQTSFLLKLPKPNFMWSLLGKMFFCKNRIGHMITRLTEDIYL